VSRIGLGVGLEPKHSALPQINAEAKIRAVAYSRGEDIVLAKSERGKSYPL